MVAGGSAWHVALRRAAHQLLDAPVVFKDPYAIPLLGPAGAAALSRTPRSAGRAWSRSLRAFAVARSCLAEGQLTVAVSAGVRQYCLLGAGLDTFALRNPWCSLRVIELDRAPMIAHKRELLRQAALPMPTCLTQVAADLTALTAALPGPLPGLDPHATCFFTMLGVAPYLEPAVLRQILDCVRAYGPGSGIVFDYRLPRTLLSEEERRQHDSLISRLTNSGEPFRSYCSPEEIAELLVGFSDSLQLTPEALNARYFAGRADGLQILGDAVRMAVAWV